MLRSFLRSLFHSARFGHSARPVRVDGFKPEVKHPTIREACRNGLRGGMMHYRDLSASIDRAPGSVKAVLSMMPEFQCVNSGSGVWRLDPHFARAGWMTVGR